MLDNDDNSRDIKHHRLKLVCPVWLAASPGKTVVAVEINQLAQSVEIVLTFNRSWFTSQDELEYLVKNYCLNANSVALRCFVFLMEESFKEVYIILNILYFALMGLGYMLILYLQLDERLFIVPNNIILISLYDISVVSSWF